MLFSTQKLSSNILQPPNTRYEFQKKKKKKIVITLAVTFFFFFLFLFFFFYNCPVRKENHD